jgi:hypothetical protein
MPAFRPFDIEGIPLGDQFKNWREMAPRPYDKNRADPYTKARIILMNGIENNSMMTKHYLARAIDDDDVKNFLALTRRAESMQQQAIAWLTPADQSVVESSIVHELLEVDLTSNLAMNEEDGYFRQVLDFALLEDLDHLYRYANLMQRLEGKDAETVTRGRTEIREGRPTRVQHRHPVDEARAHWDSDSASLRTKMNYFTIVSLEQQTMEFYKCHGAMYADDLARRLYSEIADVEQQHLSQYEAVGDPTVSLLEVLMLLELNEAYNYFCCAREETDERIKAIWQQFMAEEIDHFKLSVEVFEEYEGRDAMDVLRTDSIPALIELKPNKSYIDQVLQSQLDIQPYDMEFVRTKALPVDWPSNAFREVVNSGGVPSDDVAEKRRPKEPRPRLKAHT